MFACTRKERQISRMRHALPDARAARPAAASIRARAFRDADVLAGRFERGELVRVSGRVERFRDELQIALAQIARAGRRRGRPGPLPARLAYRDLDELEGFLEHLAREVYDPALRACWSGCSATSPCARRSARRPARCPRTRLAQRVRRLAGAGERRARIRPPRLPRRPARAHRRRRHAGARAVHAAPAPGPRPAALRRDRPRPRQDARVHLRRRDRAQPRGRAARARRARAAPDRRARARRRSTASAGSRSSTA